MKNKILFIPLICLLLAGCNKEDELIVDRPGTEIIEKNIETKNKITDYSDYIKLCDYETIEINKSDIGAPSEEEIESAIDDEIKITFSSLLTETDITDRPSEQRDNINITYTVTYDNDKIASYSSPKEGDEFVIGWSEKGEAFDQNLIGLKKGDKKNFSVEEFNDEINDYTVATYDIKVNRIYKYEIPPVTDEQAQELTDFDSYDAYCEDLRNSISQNVAEYTEANKMGLIFDKLINDSTITSYPQEEIDEIVNRIINDANYQATTQSVSVNEIFMQKYGVESAENLRETMKDEIEEYLARKMVCFEIARKENIKIEQEDIDAYCDEIRKEYNLDPAADVTRYVSDGEILFECVLRKVKPIMLEHVKIIDDTNAEE